KAPGDRPQRADDVRRALDAIPIAGDSSETAAATDASHAAPGRRLTRAQAAWLAAGAALAVAVVAGAVRSRRSAEGPGVATGGTKAAGTAPIPADSAVAAAARRVLVVPFENATGD